MMFWWYASTCRHLGFGGKPTDPAVWAAHKNAMKTYLGLKRFYTQGVFYGLDETIHCHTLPDLGQCVVNCFNIDDKPVQKEVRFRLRDVGLPAGSVQVEGAPFRQSGDEVVLEIAIPATRAFVAEGSPGQVNSRLCRVWQVGGGPFSLCQGRSIVQIG